mgnify:CR=1 FL=1
MIYHTHWIHGGRIETDTFHRMRDLERVIAIKWSPHGDGQTYEDMEQFVDRLDKRIYNLQLSRQIAIQTAPQIRMIQNVN